MKTHLLLNSCTVLTLALDGGEWPASHTVRFIPGIKTPDTHLTRRWLGPKSSLDALAKCHKTHFKWYMYICLYSCLYNGNHSPEDENKANFRNVLCIKYMALTNNGYCPLYLRINHRHRR